MMKQDNPMIRRCGIAVLAALGVLVCDAAAAESRSSTADGWAFVSGGVGQRETQRLSAERPRYSLWVQTVAQPSGAFLADAQVQIRDSLGRTVFDQALDGPWLMIDLPPGRYEVEARHAGRTERHTTTIAPHAHREVMFRFASSADVRPMAVRSP